MEEDDLQMIDNEPQCRQKRMLLGLAYPKSGCEKCGSVTRAGWRCAELPAATTRAEEIIISLITEGYSPLDIIEITGLACAKQMKQLNEPGDTLIQHIVDFTIKYSKNRWSNLMPAEDAP